MQGDLQKASPFVDHPEYNLWCFKVLSKAHKVKLPSGNNAFPTQKNTNIYVALFSVFCQEGNGIIHINANVCQSLICAEELGFKIHCWEKVEDMVEAGISHAAEVLALRKIEQVYDIKM